MFPRAAIRATRLQLRNHRLQLCVLQQGLITVLPAPTRLLIPAEGHRHIRDVCADDREGVFELLWLYSKACDKAACYPTLQLRSRVEIYLNPGQLFRPQD